MQQGANFIGEVFRRSEAGYEAARRDDGYAIRNLGPYTALAYDWFHDAIPADVRARAREHHRLPTTDTKPVTAAILSPRSVSTSMAPGQKRARSSS